MFRFVLTIIFLLALCVFCNAQSADDTTSIFSKKDRDRPKGVDESLEKMRIEKEKKEHTKMMERGEEALKLSQQLEHAFAVNGKLSNREFANLAAVEKLVKKIRNDLGGDDDNETKDKTTTPDQSLSLADAVKTLRSTTITLYDELKKTTRFTISAAAIHTSNAIIKLARILRISN